MIWQLLKSKTILFSLALAVFGVVEANLGLFAEIVGTKYYPFVTVLVGVIVAILRLVTTTSIGEK